MGSGFILFKYGFTFDSKRSLNMNKEVKTGVYKRGEKTFKFNFYTNMNIVDKMRFVEIVLKNIVSEQNYNYVLKDIIFDFTLIKMLTDIDLIREDLSGNEYIIFMEDFLKETNVIDILSANMEDGLLDELHKAVALNIEYRTGIKENTLGDALTRLVSTINDKVDNFDFSSLENMSKKLSSLNGNVSPQDIIDAYSKSDIAKKFQDELTQNRKQHNDKIDKIKKNITVVNSAENRSSVGRTNRYKNRNYKKK